MPAAPLVGAVTTRPPEAFSSLTASAHRVTQSSARSGSTPGSEPGVGDQPGVQVRRPPPHLEPARQHARGGAAVLDALLHHPPDRGQPGADLGLGPAGALVGQRHLADLQAVLGADVEQLDPGPERVGHRGRVGLQLRLARPVVVEDEAAADGVVGALADHLVARVRGEGHPVGVERQPSPPVQDQVGVAVEGDLVDAVQPQPAGLDDLGGPGRSVYRRRPSPGPRPPAPRAPRCSCRVRARSRPGSRTARRVRAWCGRAGRRRPTSGRTGPPPASGRRCGSWTDRCRC